MRVVGYLLVCAAGIWISATEGGQLVTLQAVLALVGGVLCGYGEGRRG